MCGDTRREHITEQKEHKKEHKEHVKEHKEQPRCAEYCTETVVVLSHLKSPYFVDRAPRSNKGPRTQIFSLLA